MTHLGNEGDEGHKYQWWRHLFRCRIDLLNFSIGFNIVAPYMEFLHLNWYIAEWYCISHHVMCDLNDKEQGLSEWRHSGNEKKSVKMESKFADVFWSITHARQLIGWKVDMSFAIFSHTLNGERVRFWKCQYLKQGWFMSDRHEEVKID